LKKKVKRIQPGVAASLAVSTAEDRRSLVSTAAGQEIQHQIGADRGTRGAWWTVRGSNPRPQRCERCALPTELTAHMFEKDRWQSDCIARPDGLLEKAADSSAGSDITRSP
jgi:hypothetical protein